MLVSRVSKVAITALVDQAVRVPDQWVPVAELCRSKGHGHFP